MAVPKTVDEHATNKALVDVASHSGKKPDPVHKFKLHPLWKPEWSRMFTPSALRAGAVLFLAGILCCAGGIGGGGIYVTVLMVFGQLSVWDAIPLSKVVIFAASTPSLILNLWKTINSEDAAELKTLIDWNLCRVVVPFSLIGTLLGVFLNGVIPGAVILGILSFILVGITIMLCLTGYEQHSKERREEEKNASIQAAGGTGEAPAGDDYHGGFNSPNLGGLERQFSPREASVLSTGQRPLEQGKVTLPHTDANTIETKECWYALSMLALIVYCGTFHSHATSCAADVADCDHPIAAIVSFGQMKALQATGSLPLLGKLAMVLATLYALVIGWSTTSNIVKTGQVYGSLHMFASIGHRYQGLIVGLYVFMATLTGALAGLVGIGGGLIFSPVFIQMRIDPHIAVASSATCVIFTSSSTSLQYLFADRIIVSLIFSFCIPHLLAAYCGTKLVHYIQDNYGAKKSWITWIVVAGVAISTGLAIDELIRHHSTPGAHVAV